MVSVVIPSTPVMLIHENISAYLSRDTGVTEDGNSILEFLRHFRSLKSCAFSRGLSMCQIGCRTTVLGLGPYYIFPGVRSTQYLGS
jgi:hypothetical protein